MRLLDLTGASAASAVPVASRIHAAAWPGDPVRVQRFPGLLRRALTQYDGARLILAVPGGSPVAGARELESAVGFLSGQRLVSTHYWSRLVAPALERSGLAHWADDAFELVDLAVHPAAQGAGHGTALLHHLMETTSARRILLATGPENPARRLYRRTGFHELVSLEYPDGQGPAVICGLDLRPREC